MPDTTAPETYDEDLGYSSQFFTISRRGHTSATAECGAPTMAWHVAFWPRRSYDPFSVAMTGDDGRIKNPDEIIREFSESRGKVVKDFNAFLERLQARGRHPEALTRLTRKKPFELRRPRDWEAETEPFEVFDSESMGFTLWWPDKPVAAGTDETPRNMMSDRRDPRPVRTDLRVRVQAEVSIDYSVVTFFIDAGKPWNEPPVYLSGDHDIPDDIGERRRKIFKHVKNVKTICEERLEAMDINGKRLIDLDRLPEPNPICGTSEVRLQDGATDCAKALKDAADYLYEDIWKEFCTDFGFTVNSIAGETDVIFANFRGLVMSTCGTEVTEHGKLVRAPEPKDLAEAAHPGSSTFLRFEGPIPGQRQSHSPNTMEPNAVAKAYMPFMRRFRAEGDWRDWIACGIFDWRAIYITAVGAQSEFAAFDESDYDLAGRHPSVIPAGNIPERRVNAAGTSAADGARRNGAHLAPTTAMNDRPAPFRYLLLTKFEPDRKQAGRMIDRVNSLGARRLFALKDWSVIQNASVWINHYGRQLDKAFELWIHETGALDRSRALALKDCNARFWAPVRPHFDALKSPEIGRTLRSYWRSPNRACEELEFLAARKLAQGPSVHWDGILAFARKNKAGDHAEYRTIDGDYNSDLAAIDRQTERALIAITAGLDHLGEGAVGGLPYRIARSRYYADTFRDAQINLRVGAIETWWSYEQFARRGMEPVLKFIDSVGERLEKLRARLQILKQDILQRSIAIQTEATRDNTHRLERIQTEINTMTKETQGLNVGVLRLVQQTEQVHMEAAKIGKRIQRLREVSTYSRILYGAAAGVVGAAGGGAVVWAYLAHLFSPH